MRFQKIFYLSPPIIKCSILNCELIEILVFLHDKINLNFQVFSPWWSSFTGLNIWVSVFFA